MHRYLILFVFSLFTCFSCHHSNEKPRVEKSGLPTGNVKKSNEKAKTAKLTPVAGYRFVVTGDFNGDGIKDSLVEHFFSGITHSETNKYYENEDYDKEVASAYKKKTYSFLSCNNKQIKRLIISDKPQLGLRFLKNEGDLDGDGADEIGYVVDWADWSNLNGYVIMTFKNGKWRDLYHFPIWEWQLPDMPETYNQYGIAGLQNKVSVNDTAINKKIKQNFDNFAGLVKKVRVNKIRVIFRNDNKGDVDTALVNLKRPKKLE